VQRYELFPIQQVFCNKNFKKRVFGRILGVFRLSKGAFSRAFHRKKRAQKRTKTRFTRPKMRKNRPIEESLAAEEQNP